MVISTYLRLSEIEKRYPSETNRRGGEAGSKGFSATVYASI